MKEYLEGLPAEHGVEKDKGAGARSKPSRPSKKVAKTIKNVVKGKGAKKPNASPKKGRTSKTVVKTVKQDARGQGSKKDVAMVKAKYLEIMKIYKQNTMIKKTGKTTHSFSCIGCRNLQSNTTFVPMFGSRWYTTP